MSAPFVTVVVLARNEERVIAACLESILASDYPPDRMEILVIDGMSTDRTRPIAESFARSAPRVRVLDNPRLTIPAGMNLAVETARGDIIVKMDAHSQCPAGYVSKCIRYLDEFRADNVGGVVRIVPGAPSRIARVIAGVLAHPFGSGNAYVKVGAAGPRWGDTVAYGCYRKEIFSRIGSWNEHLAGSSDLDINARIRASGGRILLVPEMVVDYQSDPDLPAFWKHNFADGVWSTYVLKFGSRAWAWRHWVPLIWVVSTVALALVALAVTDARRLLGAWVAAYLVGAAVASVDLARRLEEPAAAVIAPVVFFLRHFAHGLGAAWGLVLWALPGIQWRGRRTREA